MLFREMHVVRPGFSTREKRMRIAAFVLVLIAAELAGCATTGVQQLNEPIKSKYAPDVAHLSTPRQIPYETKTVDGVSVSCNIFYKSEGQIVGYRTTIIIRNNTGNAVTLRPVLLLEDAKGDVIEPYGESAFMQLATALERTGMAPGSATAHSPNQYPYSPSTGYSGEFLRNIKRTPDTEENRAEGRAMLQWARAFWVKRSYRIPSNSEASGALIYPSETPAPLPLRFTVTLGTRKYEFRTVAQR